MTFPLRKGPSGPRAESSGGGGTLQRENRGMLASVTVADGDLACATPVAVTPATASSDGGYIQVFVNGVVVSVGDASTAEACYFSDDGGATPLAFEDVTAGSLLYWMGTNAGYELEALDEIDFQFIVP